jgi:hypothetical protein
MGYTCYSDVAQVIPGGGLILPGSRESAEVQGPTLTPQALTARVLPGLSHALATSAR